MAALGDLIELVHEQNYLGQVCNNVYHFQVAQEPANLVTLATWFETNVIVLVRACQNDLVQHVNLRLRNVFDDGDTYEEPLTGVGSIASGTSELPAFIAYGVRFDHATGGVRPGFKRIVGVGEGQLDDSLLGTAVTTALVNYATKLLNPLSPSIPEFVHVVANRVCEVANPDPDGVPACLKYRLPEQASELNLGYIQTGEVFSQPTSQNSRKWYT